jgi:hypothetical protein
MLMVFNIDNDNSEFVESSEGSKARISQVFCDRGPQVSIIG